ncbi:MAG: DUF2508 family protein [Bacillota bacterium]|nr:DUF2508 family protein [Bacillota bacterium]
MKGVSNFLIDLSQRLLGEKSEVSSEKNSVSSASLLEKAKLDWYAAISLFNNLTDQDLVDHAIFNLNAVERRYSYLLKEARREHEIQKSYFREEEELKGYD